MPSCTNCGRHVSHQWVRVLGEVCPGCEESTLDYPEWGGSGGRFRNAIDVALGGEGS